jgi:hypothetical protein
MMQELSGCRSSRGHLAAVPSAMSELLVQIGAQVLGVALVAVVTLITRRVTGTA